VALHWAGKACQGQALKLSGPIRRLRRKWSLVIRSQKLTLVRISTYFKYNTSSKKLRCKRTSLFCRSICDKRK